MHRRADQLQQWDRVIDRLTSRADKTNDKSKADLRNHIAKIQAKKVKTENLLEQLHEAGNENWDNIKAAFEENWLELREAFLEASAGQE